MIDLTFRNIAQSFNIKKFPSGIFLKGIVVLFAVLAVIGAAVFGYHSSEIGLYTNDGYYLLYIKFLPKALLLFFLVWHNLKNGISTPASPDNRFFYFFAMLLGLAFFTILFFIIKEFAGTIAQVSLERLKNNSDIAQLPFYKTATVHKYGGPISVNLPLFLVCSLPAVLLTAYFQLVISNMASLLLYNTFRRKK